MRKVNLWVLVFLLPSIVATAQRKDTNDRWVYFFNNKVEFIDSLYLPHAILLTANGEIYDTEGKREEFYRTLKTMVGTIETINAINRIELTPEVSYEIGFFVNSKNVKFKYLIIWKKVNGEFFREVEMVSKSENEATDVAGINAARNQWMELCNHHLVKDLEGFPDPPASIAVRRAAACGGRPIFRRL